MTPAPQTTENSIVGRRYLLGGELVEVLVQWGSSARGESHGGPRNVRVRFLSDGRELVRPFRGLRTPR